MIGFRVPFVVSYLLSIFCSRKRAIRVVDWQNTKTPLPVLAEISNEAYSLPSQYYKTKLKE